MSNETSRKFFLAACRTAGIPPEAAIRAVWGKFMSNEYWIGNESKTIHGNNIWDARANAVLDERPEVLEEVKNLKKEKEEKALRRLIKI